MAYATPTPITASAGSLAVDTHATYPATTVIPDCRNIRWEKSVDVKGHGGSSTSGFRRPIAGGKRSRLSFDIYPGQGSATGPVSAKDTWFYANETGSAVAEVADATNVVLDKTAAAKEYISSSTAGWFRKIKGQRDYTLTFDILSQAGVIVGTPAWLVEGGFIDVEVRTVATPEGFKGTFFIEKISGEINIEGTELVGIKVQCVGDGLYSGDDGVIPLDGECIFAHTEGDYISVKGLTNATKGIKGIFFIERISANVAIQTGELISVSVECSGDGTPGIEAVA